MGRFVLSAAPLDEHAVAHQLHPAHAGAIVTFVGRVRDRARGHWVVKLEYEAYAEMAERVFAQIAAEAQSQFGVEDISVHHRSGTLVVGEVSVVVAVAAAHRAEAFDACRYVIDNLKQRAPIWKKEHGPQGAVWVDDRP
ncbi:MAG: molybdenum cofactor biosynthesis protein MoaE [Candidatus Eremiobacteraeota bacterium]|nr:molybdenum cofactor biosynthesis protein MoaE [Candidatus Eremiobacteraeota bacterium]